MALFWFFFQLTLHPNILVLGGAAERAEWGSTGQEYKPDGK